jgi:hypothetical protein
VSARVSTSVLIARLLGPVLLVTGLAVVARPDRFRRLAGEFLEREALLFLSGLLTLTAGLAIVNTHNVWQGWPVAITLFGWLMVLAGIARMTLPDRLKALGSVMLDHPPAIVIPGALMAALGAWLSWLGYFV